MKQNTKFLWMYVCILFSFAVILIIFAGLSTNKDIQQEKGLTNKVQHVSNENAELQKLNDELKKANDDLTLKINESNSTITNLTNTNNALTNEKNMYMNTDTLLENAMREYESNNESKVQEYLSQIDTSKMTYSQQYLYNYLSK